MSSKYAGALPRPRGAAIAAAVTLLPVGFLYALLVVAPAITGDGRGSGAGRTASVLRDTLAVGPYAMALLLAGAAVGWIWAPRANPASRRGVLTLVLGLASTATLLGAVAVAGVMAVAWIPDHLASGYPLAPAGALLRRVVDEFVWRLAIGLTALGLPSLVLTIPSACVWHWLTRRGRRASPA
jgi:hypothetical protein